MNFTAASIFGQIMFGAIGLAAFVYGKKQVVVRSMILGIVLMAYPYFFPETWMLYLIGCGLTAGLFFPKA